MSLSAKFKTQQLLPPLPHSPRGNQSNRSTLKFGASSTASPRAVSPLLATPTAAAAAAAPAAEPATEPAAEPAAVEA